MKKLVTLLCMLIFVMPVAYANEDTGQRPVDISLLSHQPTPAHPGDLLDVFIKVTNSGFDEATNVKVELLPNEVFTPQGQTVVDAGNLLAQTSLNARFKVKVNVNAPSGDNVLLVRTTQENQETQERTVEIVVQDDSSAVVIDEVRVMPEVVNPGKDASVRVNFRNTAGTKLRDVKVELDLDDTVFIPLDGTARKQVAQLSPQEDATLVYLLGVRPTATADLYRIPITITFLDAQGDTQEESDVIGLRVNTPSETRAFVQQITATEENYEVSVRIVNKGLSEIKFVEASIKEQSNYKVPVQERDVYVGNIDTDDWETIRFTLETDQERVVLPLHYTYEDAFNEEYTVQQEFTLDLPSKPEKKSNLPGIIVAVVVIILLIWYFNRRKRKR